MILSVIGLIMKFLKIFLFIAIFFLTKFLFCSQELNLRNPVKLNKLILAPENRADSEFNFLQFLSNVEKGLINTILSNFPFIPNRKLNMETVNHSKRVISKRVAQNLLFLFEEWNLFLPQKLEYWTLALIPGTENSLSALGSVTEGSSKKIISIQNNSEAIKVFSRNIKALQVEKTSSKAPEILGNLLNIGVKHGKIIIHTQTLININSFETKFTEANEKVQFEKIQINSPMNYPLTGILEFKITIQEGRCEFEDPTINFGLFENIISAKEGLKFSFAQDKTLKDLFIVGNNIKATPALVGRLKNNALHIKAFGGLNSIVEKLIDGRLVRFNIPRFSINKETLLVDKIDTPVSINIFKDKFIGSIRLETINNEFQKEINAKIENLYQTVFSKVKDLLELYSEHDPKAVMKICEQLFIDWGK